MVLKVKIRLKKRKGREEGHAERSEAETTKTKRLTDASHGSDSDTPLPDDGCIKPACTKDFNTRFGFTGGIVSGDDCAEVFTNDVNADAGGNLYKSFWASVSTSSS